jgi:predicted RNA-binding Zn ribbon-like protein
MKEEAKGGGQEAGMVRWGIADDVGELELHGGRLCLDFANTVEPRHGDHRHEHLSGYADLVRWAAHAGALDEDAAERLLREAGDRPEEAGAVLGRAVALREVVYRTFEEVARGGAPGSTDLDALGEAHAKAMAHARIAPANDGGFVLAWAREGDALDRPLWPVSRSAVDLLVSADPKRIKECPTGEGCGWLFYDESKNNSRRWCSMRGCGSRAKMRRLYARKRGRLSG